jgi:hypothetical protein
MAHPTVFGGATPPPANYQVSNSVRFRASGPTYMTRTFGALTDGAKATISLWAKRSQFGGNSASTLFTPFVSFTTPSFAGGADHVRGDGFNGAGAPYAYTNAVYRDPSAWMHICISYDGAQASGQRVSIYLNGELQSMYSNADGYAVLTDHTTNGPIGAGFAAMLGYNSGTYCFDGYVAEFFYIDGQTLSPSSFAKADANGVWVPDRYTGTYGSQGFHLEFANSAALGTDTSGNGNHWTASGFTAADQMVDTPTNNRATWNPLEPASGWTYSNGNLSLYNSGTGQFATRGTIGVSAGQWQWRVTINNDPASDRLFLGVATGATHPVNLWAAAGTYGYQCSGGRVVNGTASGSGSGFTVGDYLDFKLDMDAGTLDVEKNGSAMGAQITGLSGTFFPCVQKNSGVPSTGGVTIDFGQGFSPDSGFKTLCTANLPAVGIKNPSDHFNVVLRTGTGATANITGVPFRPGFLWSKSRSNTSSHEFYDAVREAPNYLWTDSTVAENNGGSPDTQRLVSFNSDGYTWGTTVNVNGSGRSFVDWLWKAGDSVVTNAAGSVTSQVSANPTAGFSVVTWTRSGAGDTVGHGLGASPKMIIARMRNASGNWVVYAADLDASPKDYFLRLNTTDAKSNIAGAWGAGPNATVFSAPAAVDLPSQGIAYCFAEIPGYSKFGSYTGNASNDGPFVYCGFRPRWIIIKRTDTGGAGYDWYVYDVARDAYNPASNYLKADTAATEASLASFDITASGFKLRASVTGINGSGSPFIYAAFAEHPFGGANVAPSPAR